jgi:hypothetical protein
MLTLSSHRAYLWHPGLEEWMCVAEEAYSGAPYIPTVRLQSQGAQPAQRFVLLAFRR